MIRFRVNLTEEESSFIRDNYSSPTSGIRKAVHLLYEGQTLDKHIEELRKIKSGLHHLVEELEKKNNAMVVEDYISYLHFYTKNRGFSLPNRGDFFMQGGEKILEEEKELYHAMRKDESYLYTERREAELRYGLDLSSYHHARKEAFERNFTLDLVVFSYDYRSVFFFLSDKEREEKIKLRTFKTHFIDTLRFIKPGSTILLSMVKMIVVM